MPDAPVPNVAEELICPMCGGRSADAQGNCAGCGEPVFVPPTSEPTAEPQDVPTRPVGALLILVAGVLGAPGMAVWGTWFQGESPDDGSALFAAVFLLPLLYLGGVGLFWLVTGRPPRHHRWLPEHSDPARPGSPPPER